MSSGGHAETEFFPADGAGTPFTVGEAVNGPVIGMVWAQTVDGVIGRDGGMPWELPEDMAHFRNTTTGHPVIMGRRTWESFPAKYRPLPDRTNIVMTRQGPGAPELAGAVVVNSLDAAFDAASQADGSAEIWVVGGGQIYAAALERANAAVVTVIDSTADGDTRAPTLGRDWALRGSSPAQGWHTAANGTRYRYSLWVRTA
jgi:dihydrofolate reductase